MNAPESVPRTARERARREVTNEIKQVARQHLAAHGAAALSLRAVAREVGMVSSAVYRYFPSRDDLLTALIVDAYSALGADVVAAEARVDRRDLIGRWMAVTAATRRWATASPQEYGLIFGTPVPGYRAPQDTIDPAAVVPLLMLAIVADATAAGHRVAWADRPVAPRVHDDLVRFRASASLGLDDATLVQAFMAWTQVIGAITFELFGHLNNVIDDHDQYFAQQMHNVGCDLGLDCRQ